MKFILLSDFHLTSKQPRNRTGNILADCRGKLRFIFRVAEKNNADILSAGDTFNSPRDISALFEFLQIRSKFPNIGFYTVYGQHDSYFRNHRVLNNLLLLKKANQIILLNSNPINFGDIKLYGVNWGDDIPTPEDNHFNILVIHKAIYDKPLFPGHEPVNAINFLKNHKFNLIHVGDIHRKLKKSIDQRIIVNTGPIIRRELTSYNLNHKPIVFLFDTDKPNFVETISIPHRKNPFDSRFKIDDSSEIIDKRLFKQLSEEKQLTIDSVLEELIKKHPNGDKIKSILNTLESNNEF